MVFRPALFHLAFVTALLCAGLPHLARAQTIYTWTGGSNATWNNAGNWSPGLPVDAGSGVENAIRFDSTSTANLTTTMDLASGFDLSKIEVINPAGAVTIQAVLNSSRTIDFWPASANATTIDLSAATQNLTFANNGSGVLTLNVSNAAQTWNVATGRTLTTTTVTGGTASLLTLRGGGTIVFGANADNANLMVSLADAGTLLQLAKASTAAVHALGGNLTSIIGAGTEMRMTGTGGDQVYYQHDLQVNGLLNLNGLSEGFDGLSSASGVATGVIRGGSGNVTLRINENGGAGTYGGVIENGAGTLSLVKAHSGTQILAGNNTYTGTTTISRGILQLIGTNGALSGTSAITIDGFGELRLDSRSTSNGFAAAVNANRLEGASLTLQGGVLSLYGVAGANLVEEMGAISATRGVNHIRLSSDSTAGSSVTGLSALDLSRSAGAHVVFFGDNAANGYGTDTANDVVFLRTLAGALSASELAGAGGTGAERDLVIGMYGSVATGAANGGDFMTLDSSGGYDYLRPLVSGEYATLTSGEVGEKTALQTANTTIASNTAYNALKLTGGNAVIGANKTLYLGGHAAGVDAIATVTEGAGMVLATANSGIVGFRSTLDFASREAMFRVTSGTLNVESVITGTSGLSSSGNGTLNLTGRNTFSGAVYVNEGILQVRNDRGLGQAGGHVFVTGSGGNTVLQLSNGVNVSGENVTLGVSNGSSQVGVRSNSGHNTWAGDVIAANVNLGGNPTASSQIQAAANAALTIFGNVYGQEDAIQTDNTYHGNDGGFTRRISFDNSGAGVINFRGVIRDVATGVATLRDDRLRVEMNTGDLTVNIAQAIESAGLFYVRQGYMRYEGTGNMFSSATSVTDRTFHIDASGTASEFALLLTKAGQEFTRVTTNTAAITIGNTNNTTTTNVLLGGENESGVVTFGNGAQRIDLHPRASDDTNTAGVADNFRDVRLYAMAGGEVDIRMEIMEDTGFGLANEIGAITKVGRGTVRLTGRDGVNNDVDGGVYALGGTLLLDYNTYNQAKIQAADGAQLTMAGGDVRLIKSNSGSITERATGTLTVRAGGSEISVDAASGSTVTLALAGLSTSTVDRRAGGALNFVRSGTGATSITLTRGGAGPRDVRLGGWATYGTANNTASQWAYVNASGAIEGYVHTVGEVDQFGTGLNTDLTANVLLTEAKTSSTLRINNAAVTSVDLGGFSLNLTEGGLLVGSGHNAALAVSNGSVTAGAGDLIVHHYGAGVLTLSADIVGTGGFTHAGTGTTVLSGGKSFSGTVYLSGGVLSVSDDASLGSAANGLYFGGGTLRTTASFSTARTVTLGGDGGRFEVASGTTTSLTGLIASEANFIYTETNVSTNTVVNAANTANVGVGDLIKTGTGMLVIDNGAAATGTTNTFRGLVDVREGTLRVTLPGNTSSTFTSLGTNESWLDATVVRGGATLEIFRSANTNIPTIEEWFRFEDESTFKITGGRVFVNGVNEVLGDVTFNIGSGAQLDLNNAGYLTGSGNIFKTGAGQMIILGNNPLFTGTLTVSEGNLSARGQGQNTGSNFNSAINILGSGSFRRLSSNEFTNHWLVEDHDFVVNGNGSNRLAVGNDSTPNGDDIFEFNGDISLVTNLTLAAEMQNSVANSGLKTAYARFNGQISGAGNLFTSVTIGNATDGRRGVFELNGVNTGWTGNLTVGNTSNDVNKIHVVRLGNTQATSASNNVELRHNATLQLGGVAATIGNLSTSGAAGAASTEIIENASHQKGTLTITQSVDGNWDAYFRDGTPIGTAYETEDADPAAGLALVKEGTGSAVLMLDNAYTGGTVVNQGLLQVGTGGTKAARAAGDTGLAATLNRVEVKSGATLAGTGTVVGVYDAGNAANTTVHEVAGALRPGDVVGTAITPGDPTGLGTLSITGDVDLRGGLLALQVSNPSLAVDTAFAALAPDTLAYQQYISTNLGTWEGYSTATNRADLDFLDITGQLLLDGDSTVSLAFTAEYSPVAGTVLDLVDWLGVLGGAGFEVGTNYRTGGSGGGDLVLPDLVTPGLYYDVSLFSTQGIVLIVAPEPGRAMLLFVGLAVLVAGRRQRRR